MRACIHRRPVFATRKMLPERNARTDEYAARRLLRATKVARYLPKYDVHFVMQGFVPKIIRNLVRVRAPPGHAL